MKKRANAGDLAIKMLDFFSVCPCHRQWSHRAG